MKNFEIVLSLLVWRKLAESLTSQSTAKIDSGVTDFPFSEENPIVVSFESLHHIGKYE
jgi:hypothetical protein